MKKMKRKFDIAEALEAEGFVGYVDMPVEKMDETQHLAVSIRQSYKDYGYADADIVCLHKDFSYGDGSLMYRVGVVVDVKAMRVHIDAGDLSARQNCFYRGAKSRWYETAGRRTYNAIRETIRCAGHC